MSVEYAWRPGSRIKADAESVGEHLAALRASHGTLTPHIVVEESRNPNAPLHGYFEWDDGEAAAQYRAQQARAAIGSLVVRYRSEPEGPPKTVRAFVSVRDDEDHGKRKYEATAAVMSDEALRTRAIRRAWDDLQSFKRRYGDLMEFASLFAVVDELQSALPPLEPQR